MALFNPQKVILFVLSVAIAFVAAGCTSNLPEEAKPIETLTTTAAPTEEIAEATAPTENVPAPTETEPKETMPQDAPYTVEELSAIVRAYENLDFYGCACSFSHCAEEVEERILATLPEELSGLSASVLRSDCCHTVAEAQAHMDQFFSENLSDQFEDQFLVESEGELYAILGARGMGGYGTDLSEQQIARVDSHTLQAAVKCYDCGGENYSLGRFTFCYNGSGYVLDQVESGPVTGTYYGDRSSQRAGMTITESEDGQYLIFISWANSAFDGTYWEYLCTYDVLTTTFICNGTGTIKTWQHDGISSKETIRSDGLDAVIPFEDEALQVISDNSGLEYCVFKLGY